MGIGRKDDNMTRSFVEKYFSEQGYTPEPRIRTLPWLVEEFFQRVLNIFQGEYPENRELKGRVNKIIPKIDDILSELNELKKDHEDDNDITLRVFIDFIIIPLSREGNQIKTQLRNGHEKQHYNYISKYILWIEKYYFWVKKYDKDSSKVLSQELFDHVVQESLALVKKDLDIIDDYAKQEINKIDMTVKQKQALSNKMFSQVKPIYTSLEALAKKPKENDLHGLREWRNKMDEKRQKMFNNALAAIDAVIGDEIPQGPSREEHSHLIDVLERIASIEKFVKKVGQNGDGYEKDKKNMLRKIEAIKIEAHTLSLDLRIPQDLFERLQKVMSTLEDFSKDITNE